MSYLILTKKILFNRHTDVNSATLVSTTTLTNINLPHAIEFKSDGTMMYVIDNTGTRVEQFTLSTAWDTSTLSHDDDFSVSEENQLRGLAFKPDGTRMYVIGAQKEIVYQYTLSTPWDVTTATKTTVSDDFTSSRVISLDRISSNIRNSSLSVY